MRKLVIRVFIALFVVVLLSIHICAQGNAWILDESQVISEETENYIRTLNEDVFSTYKIKPQLGVIVIDDLPDGYTIDKYKLEQFNSYGVGAKEENCGMLFVLAINNREYGLEIGDGFVVR